VTYQIPWFLKIEVKTTALDRGHEMVMKFSNRLKNKVEKV
jgi:hypothetical protein